MAIINKTGIADGNLIQSEHVTRIIDALTSVSTDTVVATGSFQGTLNGTATNAITASYIVTAQTASYILNAVSASRATSASFASRASTASFVNVINTSTAANYYFTGIDSDNGTPNPEQLYNLGVTYNPDTNTMTISGGGGTVNASSFNGALAGVSFFGSASFAVSASQAVSASFAKSASLAQTASYVLNSVSASFATTASFVLSGVTASFATSASQAISSSRAVTASFATTSSFITASNVFGPNGANSILTASFATTASYVLNAVSASFATSASRALSSSFATTASFVTPLNQTVIITGSLIATQNITSSGTLVTGSSSSTLMRISQLGAGNAFSVEDAANDTSPFLIDNGGSCLIGRSSLTSGTNLGSPIIKLDVSGSVLIKDDRETAVLFRISNAYTGSSIGIQQRFIEYSNAVSGSNRSIVRRITNGGYNMDSPLWHQYCSEYVFETTGRDGQVDGAFQSTLSVFKGWKWGVYNSSYQALMTLSSSGNLGLGIETPGYQLALSTNSAAKPTSDVWIISSDNRLKENIQEANYDICYDIIKNLPLNRYTWRSDAYTTEQVADRSKLGWIAQDVQTVFPKAVTSGSFSGSGDFYLDDCLSLDSNQIYAATYGTVKKLIQTNETLQERVTTLESELQAIKTHLGL